MTGKLEALRVVVAPAGHSSAKLRDAAALIRKETAVRKQSFWLAASTCTSFKKLMDDLSKVVESISKESDSVDRVKEATATAAAIRCKIQEPGADMQQCLQMLANTSSSLPAMLKNLGGAVETAHEEFVTSSVKVVADFLEECVKTYVALDDQHFKPRWRELAMDLDAWRGPENTEQLQTLLRALSLMKVRFLIDKFSLPRNCLSFSLSRFHRPSSLPLVLFLLSFDFPFPILVRPLPRPV